MSYVWGIQEGLKTIYIDKVKKLVTPNLHAALLQLRIPFFERILWVDAICIDQENEKEKTHQVGAMARIYGFANRVVVWLGEEAEQSALAFEELKNLALRHQISQLFPKAPQSDDANVSSKSHEIACNADTEGAVYALLNRDYFRRMWVSSNFLVVPAMAHHTDSARNCGRKKHIASVWCCRNADLHLLCWLASFRPL